MVNCLFDKFYREQLFYFSFSNSNVTLMILHNLITIIVYLPKSSHFNYLEKKIKIFY